MPRALRVEYAGAVYHVMARGNQGQRVCADDPDREMWRATLGEACARTGWRVHAWVLMGNHYHLLLETPEANLVVSGGEEWTQNRWFEKGPGVSAEGGMKKAGGFLHRPASA